MQRERGADPEYDIHAASDAARNRPLVNVTVWLTIDRQRSKKSPNYGTPVHA